MPSPRRRWRGQKAPCAHRLGEANEEAMPRARDVTPRFGPPISTLAYRIAEPGSRVPASVFSALRYREPTRLPRIQSMTGGPAVEARSNIRRFAGHFDRGPASASRRPRAVAPLREVNDERPRPGLAPSCRSAMCSSWGLAAFPRTHRLGASNPFLQPTSRSRALVAKTRSSETARRALWEDPPVSGLEILQRGRLSPSFAEDAGPPRGHPASDGVALDGASPASDRVAIAHAPARCAGKSAAAFSAARRLATRTL